MAAGAPDNERFLLSARKRKKSKTSNYLISLDLEDTSRQVSGGSSPLPHLPLFSWQCST